jgi:hypothetical protein
MAQIMNNARGKVTYKGNAGGARSAIPTLAAIMPTLINTLKILDFIQRLSVFLPTGRTNSTTGRWLQAGTMEDLHSRHVSLGEAKLVGALSIWNRATPIVRSAYVQTWICNPRSQTCQGSQSEQRELEIGQCCRKEQMLRHHAQKFGGRTHSLNSLCPVLQLLRANARFLMMQGLRKSSSGRLGDKIEGLCEAQRSASAKGAIIVLRL